ncbi:MAG: hypothetical protein ACLUFC_03145 [Anaerobutyricum hallii]
MIFQTRSKLCKKFSVQN